MSRGAVHSQSDPTDRERESLRSSAIQPHGLLLVVREPEGRIVQASTSAGALLRRPLASLLLATLRELGGSLEARLEELQDRFDLIDPQPLACTVGTGGQSISLAGTVHRAGADDLVVELEPLPQPGDSAIEPGGLEGAALLKQLGGIVQGLSTSPTLAELAHAAAVGVRELTGYAVVEVFELDALGRGQSLAQAGLGGSVGVREPALPPLMISEPASVSHLLQRVQAIVDVNSTPSELVPLLRAGSEHGTGGELDLSRCYLRSPPPEQLRQLRSEGLVSSLRVSLVREGRLWGLLACRDSHPRNLRPGVRAALELLSEVMATRIAALENHARSEVAGQARRLEQSMLQATAIEGDWRGALFRQPEALLRPMRADGALLWHGGEWRSCGQVPALEARSALLQWLDQQGSSALTACAPLTQQAPALAARLERVGALLAVRLSSVPADRLIWLRRTEGEAGSDTGWTDGQRALATALGRAVQDISVQVDAVRLLIAESQLAQVRSAVAGSKEAVVVAGSSPQAFYANEAFLSLTGRRHDECTGLDALAALFMNRDLAHRMIGHVRAEQRSWHGELALRRPDGSALPVAIRAEPVPERNGHALGFIFLFQDLTASKRADAARLHLEGMLNQVGRGLLATEGHELAGAILANASLAAMDIAEGSAAMAVAPLLQEVEASTARAAELFDRIRRLSAGNP